MATLVWVTVCVGEWSRHPRYSSALIRGRLWASTLVIRQWRSRVGCWPLQQSHSTAEQSTTTATRPCRHRLSTRAVVPRTIMLQRAHITTLRSTRQQWIGIAVTAKRHHVIQSTLTLNDHCRGATTTEKLRGTKEPRFGSQQRGACASRPAKGRSGCWVREVSPPSRYESQGYHPGKL